MREFRPSEDIEDALSRLYATEEGIDETDHFELRYREELKEEVHQLREEIAKFRRGGDPLRDLCRECAGTGFRGADGPMCRCGQGASDFDPS